LTVIPNVAGAVETSDKVASHLHPVGSFNVDDHPVPNGLEEIWRFTPLKRLRRLHTDAPLDGSEFTLTVEADDAVTVETLPADNAVKGSSGYLPNERISARAWQAATQTLNVRIPREAVVPTATVITVTGTGTDSASAGPI
jgi:Fe-S cluster assembly protein SufD